MSITRDFLQPHEMVEIDSKFQFFVQKFFSRSIGKYRNISTLFAIDSIQTSHAIILALEGMLPK